MSQRDEKKDFQTSAGQGYKKLGALDGTCASFQQFRMSCISLGVVPSPPDEFV